MCIRPAPIGAPIEYAHSILHVSDHVLRYMELCPTTDIFLISTYIGCNRPLTTTTDSNSVLFTTDYNPVYIYKPITTQIDYNLALFWVVIEIDSNRYRS